MEDKIRIRGNRKLTGEVTVSSCKNAAVAILPSVVLASEVVKLFDVPDIQDIKILIKLLKLLNIDVTQNGDALTIDTTDIKNIDLMDEDVKRLRASYYFMGALLGRFKHVRMYSPGGCNLGPRPIDLHLKGFRALGGDVKIEHGFVKVKADELKGSDIYLDVVTVGATINIMLAACLAEGKTTIENAAKEPHVVDIANFLNSMGANIKGAGTDVIRITGVSKLHGTNYSVIPDQIEAGTFMTAAAVTKGDILIKNVIPKHLESITAKLIEMGCEIEEFDDAVRVVAKERLKRTNIKTLPYPGFPTDMQPQGVVALALADGASIVTESIFENRFKYVDELARMGANIKIEGNAAIIEGVERYSGASISAPDLRAGAALVIAGLAADGFTTIEDIQYIERGYEDLPAKLQSLGGKIQKVSDEKEIQKFKLKIG